MKKILPIIIISALIGQDRYDPLTGERIPNKKFDPNTGEIIEQKYDPYTGDVIKKDSDGLTAKVILNSGDIIEGKLIIQDKNKVTIDSEILGKVSIDRIDIKSMTSGGIPKSTRRVAKTPTIKTDNSNTDLSNNGFEIFSNAKNEAQKSNSQILNLAVGTGACLNPAFFATLPVMGLAIYANVNVKEPKSEFYKNLNGNEKKQFTKVYKKEIRRLRTEQCLTPTGLVLGFFGLMIFFG